MRIGLNLLPLVPDRSGGIEWYVRSLVETLPAVDESNEYYLFTSAANHESFAPDTSRVRRVLCPAASVSRAGRLIVEQLSLPRQVVRWGIDVLHSPFYTWPLRCRVPGVVTICDMLYEVHPQWIGQPKLAFWRMFVPQAAKRCRRIITLSENSKRDIVRFLRVPVEKVVVTPLAADVEFTAHGSGYDESTDVCHRYGIRSPYVLSVGGAGANKNTVTLVRAFSRYCRQANVPRLSLAITGQDFGARREIAAAVSSLGLEDSVRLTGHVPRRDLPALYRAASVYVSVSWFEGFGLTPLEAMACGVPVIVANRTSLPEVVGGAGLIVEPEDVAGLTECITRVVIDHELRRRLSVEGLSRAKEFTWKRTALQTLAAYCAAGSR
jgi:glycosyltransferase involved in cell wall biosynthesis